MTIRLPSPCLVVLVGPAGAGKSTWARRTFRADQVVSSDALRALVGEGEHDQRAGTDAFAVLDDVVDRRLRRGLLTVIDSLGLDASKRWRWLRTADRHGVACHAVVFPTSAELCRARNRARPGRPVPARVLTSQLASFEASRPGLAAEGFAAVHEPGPVRVVPPQFVDAPSLARRQQEDPVMLRFGLQIPSFTWEGGPPELADRLGAIAEAAEAAGFSSLWLMDHFLQIPYVGREWLEMLDSYTTLGFLAARTQRMTLGTLVTGVTYRNVGHLAKIVATLDVLSGGRAVCGIGAAWFEREHRAYGWTFPPLAERYALLEDALQALPVLWGKGSPPFDGTQIHLAETMCYPRPLQEHVPILVGGGGERKTLRLVAQYADACNIFGEADTVRHKIAVLHDHCAVVGRDPSAVRITQLSTALAGADERELAATVERLRPPSQTPEAYAKQVSAGTISEHVGRFRGLAEAGVQDAIVSFPDLSGTEPVERFAAVIDAFS